MKHTLLTAFLLSSVLQPVSAAIIHHTDITASTSIVGDVNFPINEIADGITSDAVPGFNGFAAASATSGTIQFDFSSAYNLSGFVLYNDINVLAEGIKDFRLDFYDGLNQPIATPFSTLFTGPKSQVAGESYDFGTTVTGVERVDLVVFNTNTGGATLRMEIREVEFTIGASPVPVPAAVWLFVSGLIGLVATARRKN